MNAKRQGNGKNFPRKRFETQRAAKIFAKICICNFSSPTLFPSRLIYIMPHLIYIICIGTKLFRPKTPAKSGPKYRFYEVRPNLNSDASNLNLVARSFYEMPSVFFAHNNGFRRGASTNFFRRKTKISSPPNVPKTTDFLKKSYLIIIFNIFYPPPFCGAYLYFAYFSNTICRNIMKTP